MCLRPWLSACLLSSFLGVWTFNETRSLVFDILHYAEWQSYYDRRENILGKHLDSLIQFLRREGDKNLFLNEDMIVAVVIAT